MPTSITTAAEWLKDQYFQDYPDRDAFIEFADFKFAIATAYSTLLDSKFQILRAQNKSLEGFSNIENSSDWLKEEVWEMQYDEEKNKYFTKSDYSIYAFDFDGSGSALQGICGLKDKFNRFRKISLNERRFYEIVPPTDKVFYYLNNGNEIVYKGKVEAGEKIIGQYIPSIVATDDTCLLSDNIVWTVIKEAYNVMVNAKNSTVIQEVNDGNKNVVLQQQTNPQLNKIQQP